MSDVILEKYPIKTFVKTNLTNLYNIIDNILKARMENYYFSPKYKAGVWDGYIRFFNKLDV